MPIKNRYWKSLMGADAQGLIAGAVAYTSQTTYSDFVTNGVAGELGVFNADTYALVSGGGAASTTINLFIAVKRDATVVERTSTFRIEDVTATRTAYSAQVKQVTNLSVGAALVVQDITYINRTSAPATITYVVAGNNTALSVSVTGTAITVNLATNGSGVATSTATQVAAAVLASTTAAALVGATVTGTGATVQAAQAVTTIAASAAVTAGKVYDVTIMETTPGNQPFPTWEYQYTAILGDTLDTVMTNLTAQINNTASKQNTNRDLIVTATYSSALSKMTITAINFGVSFRVLPKIDLYPYSSVVYTTPMHMGSGFAEQMVLFENEFDIKKGVTTNYPLQGSNPADYGKPADLVDSTTPLGYNIYTFQGFASEVSKTPHKKWHYFRTAILGVPSTGTTPEAQVKAIFGL